MIFNQVNTVPLTINYQSDKFNVRIDKTD